MFIFDKICRVKSESIHMTTSDFFEIFTLAINIYIYVYIYTYVVICYSSFGEMVDLYITFSPLCW